MRKIKTAYDAFWFIKKHPQFSVMERTEVSKKQAPKMKSKGYLIEEDRNGFYWRYWRHLHRKAMDDNLEIFYAKNKIVECWLEFGKVYYGFYADWDKDKSSLLYEHDTDLDCGGVTFDEALIKLAKKILRKYGDYKDKSRPGKCGKPCGDCRDMDGLTGSRMVKKV